MSKIALISGGTAGIGKAIVTELMEAGFRVTTFARGESDCQKLEADLTKTYGPKEWLVQAGDVIKEADAERVVNETIKQFGRIDILINNAGIGYFASCDEADFSAFERMMEVNMMGVARLTKLVVPHMKKQTEGQIINIVSMSGKRSRAKGSFYSATKFAVMGYSAGIREELTSFGIKVATICPGMVNTHFHTKKELEQHKKIKYDRMPVMLAVSDVSRTVLMICTQSKHCDIQDINILPFE